jgi:hypothetical protein
MNDPLNPDDQIHDIIAKHTTAFMQHPQTIHIQRSAPSTLTNVLLRKWVYRLRALGPDKRIDLCPRQ